MQLPAAERFFKVNKWAEKLSFCLLTSSQFCHPSYILRSIACCLSSAQQSVMLRWPDLKVFDLICINEFSRKFFYVSMYELSWRSWRGRGVWNSLFFHQKFYYWEQSSFWESQLMSLHGVSALSATLSLLSLSRIEGGSVKESPESFWLFDHIFAKSRVTDQK